MRSLPMAVDHKHLKQYACEDREGRGREGEREGGGGRLRGRLEREGADAKVVEPAVKGVYS
jgi:hypothetical protein